MSEEILKALMQLFAIISKQDEGTTENQRNYVESFLNAQLGKEKVDEYLTFYDEKAAENKKKGINRGKMTAMRDSVKTLTISRKINKTLTQKQKIIVLVRILELLKAEQLYTEQRMGIIETISDVFNVTKEELELISSFIRFDDPEKKNYEEIMVIHNASSDLKVKLDKAKHFETSGLDQAIYMLKIRSVDLYFMKYKGQSEITLNGMVFNQNNIYIFPSGSTLRLPKTTIYYSDIVSRFIRDENVKNISFKARNISYEFPGGKVGLRNVDIAEEFGLIGIMGASGSGKTTLLNVLSGIEKPKTGNVSINGIDVHTDTRQAKAMIGYIAQDDFLFEDLTVFENLYYNAKLCFKDLDNQKITDKVNTTLENLGLGEIKDIKVGSPLNKKISGGQRKRLNIALELIREPSVLFVDEPTSGLSSKDSENVMDLLKELSLNMKLIFVVIHQPSSDIFKMFDRLFLLDTGGYPIYYGNPVESLIYFKGITNQINADVGECSHCGNVNPELLFNIIEAKEVDDYGRFTRNRIKKPKDWHELFLVNQKKRIIENVEDFKQKILNIPGRLKQFGIFIQRDVLSKLGNVQYLLINLLETPLLALILTIIIRYASGPEGEYIFRENENIPPYIFMSIIIALFVGLSVSAEEIFRDRKILKREAFLNLSRSGYLMSKIVILFGLSAYQSLVFVLIGNAILEIQGLFFEYWLVLFAASCFANMLGLNISSSFNSAVTIYILIPLLVIPQMILGGAMFSFDKLNSLIGGGGRKAPLIADIMTSRWAYEALAVAQFKDNPYEKNFYELDKLASQIDYKQAYYIPELERMIRECEELSRKNPDRSSPLANKLSILQAEFNNESSQFRDLETPDPHLFGEKDFDALKAGIMYEFIDELKNKYIRAYTIINEQKTQKIKAFEERLGKDGYRDLYRRNHNEFLESLVKKSTVNDKIIVENNRLCQVLDPVFIDPEPDNTISFRSHFYAPWKSLLGWKLDTLVYNLGVIWLFTLMLGVTLYYDLLKKALGIFSRKSS
ncbi:MAG: ATP-binding cassette domain-containing protein [Bacteroidota bacterium]